jgi:hypothetical protein
MSSMVFGQPSPDGLRTRADSSASMARHVARWLRWCGSAAAMAIAVAGCGGGSNDQALTPEAQAQRAQTASVIQAQQSVSQLMSAVVQPGSGTENFEAGMGDWQNWGNAQVVAGAGVSGSNALQVGPGAGGAALHVPNVVGGTTYRLTAQVRATDPVQGPTTLGVDFYDASGARIATRAPSNITSTSFAAFSYDVTAPAGTSYALVWVWKNGSTGFAYVDDVTFGPASAPPPPPPPPADGNLVSNGGFESGMTGWTDWGNTRVANDQPHSGTSALSVGTAAGGAGYNVDGIVPGKTYRLSVSAKVSDASDKVYVGVNFVDAAGSLVTSTQRNTTSTTYSTLSSDIVAPTGAVRGVVYVWKNAGSGLASVDDFNFGVVADPAPMFPTSVNLVVLGDFRIGLTAWENWGNTTSTTIGSSAPAAQVGPDAGGFGQRIAGIVAGQTYRLTAQVSVTVAGETGYLGLKFLDAAGNSVQDQVVPFTSTATSGAQVELLAPANAATALVYVWKNAGSGFAVVDDVSLVTVAPGSSSFTPVSDSPPVLANTTTTGRDVAVLKSGTRIAAWSDDGGVHTQRIDARAGLVGSSVLIAPSGSFTGLAALSSGGYVVQYTLPDAVLVQIMDATGVPTGAPVVVRTQAQVAADPRYQLWDQARLAGGAGVFPNPDGGFIAVYREFHAVHSPWDRPNSLFAQRFDALGTPVGSPKYVGDDATSAIGATPSGGLVTSGLNYCGCSGSGQVWVSMYDSGLNQTLLPVRSDPSSDSPNAAGLANGAYVAIWGYFGQVYGEIFAPQPGGGFQDVTPRDPYTAHYMNFPSAALGARVTALATGGFLVSWGTSAQAYSAAGFPIGEVAQILDGKITATPEGGFVVVAQVGSQLLAQQYVPRH